MYIDNFLAYACYDNVTLPCKPFNKIFTFVMKLYSLVFNGKGCGISWRNLFDLFLYRYCAVCKPLTMGTAR